MRDRRTYAAKFAEGQAWLLFMGDLVDFDDVVRFGCERR